MQKAAFPFSYHVRARSTEYPNFIIEGVDVDPGIPNILYRIAAEAVLEYSTVASVEILPYNSETSYTLVLR